MSTSENLLFTVIVLHICEDITSEIIQKYWLLLHIHLTAWQSACRQNNTSEFVKIDNKIKHFNISLYFEQIHLQQTENDQLR